MGGLGRFIFSLAMAVAVVVAGRIDARADVAGSWSLHADGVSVGCTPHTPCGGNGICGVDICRAFNMGGTIIVSQSGAALSAAANDGNGNPYTLSGSVNGSAVTFTIQGTGITPGVGPATTTYTGTLNQGRIEGSFSGQASWTYADGSGNPVSETATWTGTFTVTLGMSAGGSVSGSVSYSGSKTGTVYVGLFKSTGAFSPGVPAPAYATVLSGPGPFTISNVPDGTYYVGAVMTRNLNAIAMDDPYGRYGTPVAVTGGSAQGINFGLTDGTADAPNPFYIPRNVYDPILGTWGYTVLRHDSDGKWYSRVGSVSFGSDGRGVDSYMNNSNGALGSGEEPYEYSAISNHDGTIAVYYIYSNRILKHRYALSDDASQMIVDGSDVASQQRLRIMGRLDTAGSLSNADLNGQYYTIGYEHNARPVSPPDGNGAYMAISGITTFDGSGQYTYENTANSDGLTWSDSGSGTYSVGSGGLFSIGRGGIGGLGYGGNFGLMSGTSPDQWATYAFMKKGDRTYATPDAAGTWAMAGFGDINGSGIEAAFGTATCDSAGNCSLSWTAPGIPGSEASFTISPDGSFGASIGGMAPSSAGAIGNNGQTMIANMTFSDEQGSSRHILFGIRCTQCTGVAPPPSRFTLSALKSGTGSGVVVSGSGGIICGPDCTETYAKGQTVTLLASPQAGSVFEGWTGACTGTGRCVVTMDGDKTATAMFRQEKAQPAVTKLTLSSSSKSILRNASLDAEGRLTRLPDQGTDMTGLPIDLAITGPDGSAVVLSTTAARDGSYSFHGLSGFTDKGTYTLTASFGGTGEMAPAQSDKKSIVVNAVAGYAVIVEGRLSDNSGLESHNKTANRIYDSLTDRGLTDENIYFLSYSPPQQGNIIDAAPSKSAIKNAVETWAKSRMNASPAPFYLIMVDHGNRDAFIINNETISPVDLAAWLTRLESGLTAEARQEIRAVIIGACYSGSFIPGISSSGRLVVTSARANEQSYKGEMEEDGVRSGEFFMDELFTQLGRGYSMKSAFEYAAARTQDFTSRASDSGAIRYIDGARQHPLLDDNGDGRGSSYLSANGEGRVADRLYLGSGYTYNPLTFANSTEITAVRETAFLSPSSSSAILWARVAAAASSVWVEIRRPSLAAIPSGGTNQVALDLPRISLAWNAGQARWEGTYEAFTESGRYDLFYHAKDKTTGKISPVKRAVVYKDREGNNPPPAVSLAAPVDGSAHDTVLTLDWTDSTDADGDSVSYTVMVSRDPAFGSVDYIREGLTHSTAIAGLQDELADLTVWYWKVRTIDFYGGMQESVAGSFVTINDNTNACVGRIYGTVSDDVTQRGIPAASISSQGGGSVTSLPDGFYMVSTESGPVTVTVNAGGYNPAQLSEFIAPCELLNRDISLVPKDRCAATLAADLTLRLPIISYDNNLSYLKADFAYKPSNDGTALFELKAVGEGDPAEYGGCEAAGLTAGLKLHIPLVSYETMTLWADLEYVPSEGSDVVFKVTTAGFR